jgi:sugar lactone lactonase YvrE
MAAGSRPTTRPGGDPPTDECGRLPGTTIRICIDAERAVWYADVGNRHCVRVREGGEILATVDLNRGAFACTLSRDDKPQLYVVGQQFGGPEATEPTGQVVVFPAPAVGAGKP